MDLSIIRGDSVAFDMVVTSLGVAYNLTGATIWFTAKYNYQDPDASAVFQKKTGSGIVITNATSGMARVTLAPSDTSPLPNTKTMLLWDAQVKDSLGSIYTVANGNLIVTPDVTLSIV